MVITSNEDGTTNYSVPEYEMIKTLTKVILRKKNFHVSIAL